MPGPPSLCCSELLGGGPGTSQGVVALVLTGDTGRPALVLCWNASLTLLWLTRGGGALEAVSPMTSLGLLLSHPGLCLQVS